MQKDVSVPIRTFTDTDPAPWRSYRPVPKSKSEDGLTGDADKILEMIQVWAGWDWTVPRC